MQSVIQILKVNDRRTGNKDGRVWEMQDAECLLLKETGEVDQVGVLQLPKDLRGKAQPGVYSATFALRPNLASRRIEAILTGLTAIPAPATPKAK
jgi:hypothetical protein